jgi:hypothetical protein
MKKSRIASPLTPLLATALFALPGVVRAADSIRWTDSYALAQKIAAQEGKPIWIAYTARRPYAEDPWAKGTLKDKRCHELLRGFVPVLAGPFADGFGRPSRSEKSAAKIWAELLEPVFKTGAGERPPSPQHLFVDAEGKPILAIPYDVRPAEFAWALREVLRLRGQQPGRGEEDEHAPVGLWVGDRLRDAGVTEPRPSEVRKALQDMQKPQLLLRNARDLLRTLVVTDDRRAQQLFAGRLKGARGDLVRGAFQLMAEGGDPSWCTLVEPWLDHRDDGLRRYALWALRERRPEKFARQLRGMLRKEESSPLRGRVLRSWVRCAPDDERAIDALRSALEPDADKILRLHATLAVREIEDRSSAIVLLGQSLHDPEPLVRAAAAYGIVSRQERALFPELERTIERERDDGARGQLRRCWAARHKPQRNEFTRLPQRFVQEIEKQG